MNIFEFLQIAFGILTVFFVFCFAIYILARLITKGILKTIDEHEERGSDNGKA
jgi:F0F1-type ATP synthase membrane subunit b/b'